MLYPNIFAMTLIDSTWRVTVKSAVWRLQKCWVTSVSAAQTALNEDMSVKAHHSLYISQNKTLLKMDEVFLLKRAAEENTPRATASSGSSFHNRTRAAQLLIEAGPVPPVGPAVQELHCWRKTGLHPSLETGCYTAKIHTAADIERAFNKQNHSDGSLISWLMDVWWKIDVQR